MDKYENNYWAKSVNFGSTVDGWRRICRFYSLKTELFSQFFWPCSNLFFSKCSKHPLKSYWARPLIQHTNNLWNLAGNGARFAKFKGMSRKLLKSAAILSCNAISPVQDPSLRCNSFPARDGLDKVTFPLIPDNHLLAPKLHLEDLWPMITIPSIHPPLSVKCYILWFIEMALARSHSHPTSAVTYLPQTSWSTKCLVSKISYLERIVRIFVDNLFNISF